MGPKCFWKQAICSRNNSEKTLHFMEQNQPKTSQWIGVKGGTVSPTKGLGGGIYPGAWCRIGPAFMVPRV